MKKVLNHFFCLFVVSVLIIAGCSDDSDVEGIQEEDSTPFILPDVHDPSQLVQVGNRLYFFASAVEWWTYDLAQKDPWVFGGSDMFEQNSPSWYNGEDMYWAPSFTDLGNGTYRMYHSAVEDEDTHSSKIGFVDITNASNGDPEFILGEDYVLSSSSIDDAFAIDPSVYLDKQGQLRMVYGSHGAGIYTIKLDKSTGYLAEDPSDKAFGSSDGRFVHLANYGGVLDENNIEAAYIYNHPENAYYYLFVNWDICCSGVNSTYNIRVGRSADPEGPFLDRAGNDMADGYGSLFMDAEGVNVANSRIVGPGHSGIYQHSDGSFYFSHHFYDAVDDGAPSLAIWQLIWVNDWPEINLTGSIDF